MDIFIFDGEGVDDDDSLMAVRRKPWTRHSYDLTIQCPAFSKAFVPQPSPPASRRTTAARKTESIR